MTTARSREQLLLPLCWATSLGHTVDKAIIDLGKSKAIVELTFEDRLAESILFDRLF